MREISQLVSTNLFDIQHWLFLILSCLLTCDSADELARREERFEYGFSSVWLQDRILSKTKVSTWTNVNAKTNKKPQKNQTNKHVIKNNLTENMEALVLMVRGYVRMTQWGRAVERQPELHAKHSTFPITRSRFPCASLVSPSSNAHACTQNPHTPPVGVHMRPDAPHSRCWTEEGAVLTIQGNCFIQFFLLFLSSRALLLNFPFLDELIIIPYDTNLAFVVSFLSPLSFLSYILTHFYNPIKRWKNTSVRRQTAAHLMAWMDLFIWTDRPWMQPS